MNPESATPGSALLLRVGRVLLGCASAAFILVLAGTVAMRVGYPFELEWMEGHMLQHVLRLREGKPQYVEPGLEFVPQIYPPLLYWLGYLTSLVSGPGFVALRAVSALAGAGVLLLLGLFAARESGRASHGLLAAGFFAATYAVSGGWLDLARSDALLLFWWLAAAYGLRFSRTRRGACVAGACGVLALLSKQTALPLIVAAGLFSLPARPRRGAAFLATFAGGAALSVLALNAATDGWYFFHVFELPASLRRDPDRLLTLAGHGRAMACLPAVFLALLHLLRPARRAGGRGMHAGLLLSATFVSLTPLTTPGAYLNTLMPLLAVLGLLLPLGLDAALALAERNRGRTGLLQGGVVGLCLAQLLLLTYDPRVWIPDRSQYEAGQRFCRWLEEIPGDVFIPFHSYYAELAGKRRTLDVAAYPFVWLYDRSNEEIAQVREELLEELRCAVAEQEFAAIVLDADVIWAGPSGVNLLRYYRRAPDLSEEDVPVPVSGWQTRPRFVYVPR